VLRILHTADWHLGRRFPSFPEEAQKKLSRARMDVVNKILDLGRRNTVNAILCAGDLFDDPTPSEDFWEGLAKTLRDHPGPHVPIFLVPGNHDPLTPESVWAPTHPFRSRLPKWVHVVDGILVRPRAGRSPLRQPVGSRAGENDRDGLPARDLGGTRLRIGCVHGCTRHRRVDRLPDLPRRGRAARVDYLAIGDTHSFRDVTESLPVPTVCPELQV
jgi:predicted phosphodiesterase